MTLTALFTTKMGHNLKEVLKKIKKMDKEITFFKKTNNIKNILEIF